VAGEMQGTVQGEEINSLTEKGYRYPLILSKEIHLWKNYLYPYSETTPPYGPWGDDFSETPLRF
jgi:starvation-inducible outer membrane lipoprotein